MVKSADTNERTCYSKRDDDQTRTTEIRTMKIGMLTGGGDCPGLNPAMRGFVLRALDYGFEVWGIREGWRGLVKGIVEDEPLSVARVEGIICWGGTMLRSSRTNPYKDPAQLQAVKANIAKFGFE